MIQQAWETQKAIKEVMVFLQGHGVSTTYAVKIYKQYGERAIATVTENPYQLATDIYGIGFISADKIARNLGVPADSEFRYSAGLVHSLTEAAEDGHCYLPQPELIKHTYSLLITDSHTPDEDAIARIITHTSEQQDLVIETHPDTPPLCYKPTFYYTEQNLGQRLAHHLRHQNPVDLPRVRNWISRFTASRSIQLSPQQQQAVEIAASAPLMILTGGPGCGKTFTTHTIVSLWKAMGKSLGLAAPTGRAAQRLTEMSRPPGGAIIISGRY